MAKKIIIADTNRWVSLVIAGFDTAFFGLLENERLEFCSSKHLENEIEKSFKKQKLQKYISGDIVTLFWIVFHQKVSTIDIISTVRVCRDPKDDFLLAPAKDAHADFLITGDKDLLVLEKFESTIICTLSDFINKHLQQ